jgi:plasmid stabilization system protein ParE
MKVTWSQQAAESLRDAITYVRKEFGVYAKQRIVREVQEFVTLLSQNPELGKVEPLLQECPVEYRSYVINRINKAVYYINSDTNSIEIVALWDTRREPKSQAEQIYK